MCPGQSWNDARCPRAIQSAGKPGRPQPPILALATCWTFSHLFASRRIWPIIAGKASRNEELKPRNTLTTRNSSVWAVLRPPQYAVHLSGFSCVSWLKFPVFRPLVYFEFIFRVGRYLSNPPCETGPQMNESLNMNTRQLEMGLGAKAKGRCRARGPQGRKRAQWWFSQMRVLVNNAVDWKPAPPSGPEQTVAGLSRGE